MEAKPARSRIVVGVDGSQPALRALQWAAVEAARRGAGVDVVHAWMAPYPLVPGDYVRDPGPYEARGRDVLEHAVATLTGDADLEVRPLLVEDHATSALLHAADAAHLLVVGSRGRGGFSGLLLGSVSQHCIHHAPCPVAVVPPTWRNGNDRRVVVGVDGSEPSYAALRWAVDAAARRHADLDVVNAYDYMQFVVPVGLGPAVDRDTLEKDSKRLLEQMVEPVLGCAAQRPADVALIPDAASPARAVLATATGADLLVVGSRGRGGVRGLLFGSVSQQCVTHAHCPVVVVPTPTDREPDERDLPTTQAQTGWR